MTHRLSDEEFDQYKQDQEAIVKLFHLFAALGIDGVEVDLVPVIGTNEASEDAKCMALGFMAPDFGSATKPVRYYMTERHPEFAAVHDAWMMTRR